MKMTSMTPEQAEQCNEYGRQVFDYAKRLPPDPTDPAYATYFLNSLMVALSAVIECIPVNDALRKDIIMDIYNNMMNAHVEFSADRGAK